MNIVYETGFFIDAENLFSAPLRLTEFSRSESFFFCSLFLEFSLSYRLKYCLDQSNLWIFGP